MTPESGRTGRGRIGARWALAVLLLALSSVATLSDAQEPDKTGPSGHGRARPIDVVKSSVDRVLAVVQASSMPVSEGRRRSDIRQLADGLIDNGTRWVVYDVVLDGVSLVSNYRSQFNSIIRTSSFADLLTKLRNKEIAAHVVPRIG